MNRLPRAASADARFPDVVQDLAVDRALFLAFLRRRAESKSDAEDLLQQALLKAAVHAHELEDRARARSWFFRILRNVVVDDRLLRRRRAAKLTTFAADVEGTVEPPSTIRVTTCGCSLGQLARLRPEYAEILRRVDLHEGSLAREAEALGITVENAAVRLHRARKALRDRLRACGTTSLRSCLDCRCSAR